MNTRYDFNKVISRKNTASLKYDFGRERKGREDLIPLWVADMDFTLPDEILEPMKDRIAHGIFGYTDPTACYQRAVSDWYERRHGYRPEAEWNTITPGVVYAIATAIRAYTDEGDAVLIQEPVYYPFRSVVKKNHRKLVNSPLININGHYEIDFDDLERKIKGENVRLFILCSPHNPVGRVWTREELERLSDICLRHDVIVVSDEIHADFTYGESRHIPLPLIGEEIAKRCVVCTSPSKTFNIAGLQVANIFIQDATLRAQFRCQNGAQGYSQGNTLGLGRSGDRLDELFEKALQKLTDTVWEEEMKLRECKVCPFRKREEEKKEATA